MLKKIRLTDFKSFVDEEVELAPLTLLIGANASGKSNFLDAIRFLQGLSQGLTIPEVLNGEERAHSGAWPGLRGRMEESARFGRSAFAIESEWVATGGQEVRHQIECQTAPFPARRSEWVEDGNRRIVAPTKLKPHDNLLKNLDAASTKPEKDLMIALLEELAGVRFLDIQPSVMRDYGRRGAPLGDDGKNFSGVLASLSEDEKVKHSFVVWLREICAPEIEDLDFAEIKELGDVMAIFVEKGGARISARSLSDGTLRFMGILLALQTANPGDIFLVEEIGEGLHPTRMQFFLKLLESAVLDRDIQVIATTHSPGVLQWLTSERLREVLVFGRIPGRSGSVVRRLGEITYFEEVIQVEEIDELFSAGWLETAL